MPSVPARNVSTTYFATDPTEVRVSVCVVVRRGDGSREILLMRRSDNAHWGLPGGYVEPGESVIAAAAREVREETGFEVEIGRLVGVYSDPKSVVIDYGDRRRVQAINLCFEGVAKERGEATTPHETLDVGFFEVAALPRPFVPIHEIRVQDAERGDDAVAVR
jgi:ADP-ribose pyrophosphatase YjhB (NUDIX family)